MLFPTCEYAFFFLVVFAAYWLLARWPYARKGLILAASYFFYAMWDLRFVPLLIGLTLAAYGVGWGIGRVQTPRSKKGILAAHVTLNLGVLGFFKYYDFFRETLETLLLRGGLTVPLPTLEVVLPVGISFITFQTLTYTIDIYRGQLEPTHNLLDVAVFVAFFPNLLAGPIARARHILPQIAGARPQEIVSASLAYTYLLSGLFKKLILSTYLQTHLVDGLFSNPEAFGPLAVAAGIYGYAIQLYLDFSGYSDLAIGSGLLLGVRLPDNFASPYIATNPQQFWRRWHISLSFWLRDYLYVSLGGNRRGRVRELLNIMITMVLGGLWHGAKVTFIIWGLMHGAAQVLHHALFPHRKDRPVSPPALWTRVAGWLFTFHFVCIAWVFFRAADLDNALAVLGAVIHPSGQRGVELFAVVIIVGVLLAQWGGARLRNGLAETCARLAVPARATVMALLAILVLMMRPEDVPPFLYFKF